MDARLRAERLHMTFDIMHLALPYPYINIFHPCSLSLKDGLNPKPLQWYSGLQPHRHKAQILKQPCLNHGKGY